MKRVLLVAVFMFTMNALFGPAQTAQAEGKGPCSGWFSTVRPSMGTTEVERRVRLLITCAERKWPTSPGLDHALYIAERESSFWPWAQNPSSLCSGVYQHVLSAWPGRVALWWDPDWFWRTPSVFNARANVIIAIRMAHVYGWSPWGG